MNEKAPALEAHIPGLRRYAWALLGDHEAADDLVHDTLQQALADGRIEARNGQLRCWLYSIERALFLDGDHRPTAQSRTSTETTTNRPPMRPVADIAASLDHLPEPDRSALLLVGVERLSYQDAAQVLVMTEREVVTSLTRARRALREMVHTPRAVIAQESR